MCRDARIECSVINIDNARAGGSYVEGGIVAASSARRRRGEEKIGT